MSNMPHPNESIDKRYDQLLPPTTPVHPDCLVQGDDALLTRNQVFDIVRSERDYQDSSRGNSKRHAGRPAMTPGEYLLCMEYCLHEAKQKWYKPDGIPDVMDQFRKITALGVAAMQLHGARYRDGNSS